MNMNIFALKGIKCPSTTCRFTAFIDFNDYAASSINSDIPMGRIYKDLYAKCPMCRESLHTQENLIRVQEAKSLINDIEAQGRAFDKYYREILYAMQNQGKIIIMPSSITGSSANSHIETLLNEYYHIICIKSASVLIQPHGPKSLRDVAKSQNLNDASHSTKNVVRVKTPECYEKNLESIDE